MAKKREIKSKLKDIANYWIKNSDIEETFLNFDWSEAETHCWNCGDNKYSKNDKKARLERCHIVPSHLGGEDIPSNYVLLCKECHKDSPDRANKEDMWDWIKSNKLDFAFYDTYKIQKALLMFVEKNGYSFFDKAIKIKNIDEVIRNEFKKCGTHGFSHSTSTIYYLLKAVAKHEA